MSAATSTAGGTCGSFHPPRRRARPYATPGAVPLLVVHAAGRRGPRDVRLARRAGGSARHPSLILVSSAPWPSTTSPTSCPSSGSPSWSHPSTAGWMPPRPPPSRGRTSASGSALIATSTPTPSSTTARGGRAGRGRRSPDRPRWPELAIRHALGERDLLFLLAPSPTSAGRSWPPTSSPSPRLGVVDWVSLGAVPAAVPHTRPVPVMATASGDGLLAPGEASGPEGRLRVPAAALSVLEMEVAAAGIPSVGFYAQVPPYSASATRPPASPCSTRWPATSRSRLRPRPSWSRRSANSAPATTRPPRATRSCATRSAQLESVTSDSPSRSSCPWGMSLPARSSASCAARATPATADR